MKDKSNNSESTEELNRVIPVVFAADDCFALYAGVTIASLIAHADPRHIYRVFVLYTAISPAHVEALETLSTDKVTVQCLNVERALSSVHAILPCKGRITRETYYRLLIPKLDELNIYSHVVYLDCDVIVNSDIAGIIPENMGDSLIAAVRDLPQQWTGRRERLERDYQLKPEQYINAGVLVFNVRQWMKEETADRCFEYLNNPTGKYLYMDQDTINIICENRIYYLDESWNYNWYLLYGEEAFVEECRPITERIGDSFHVLHYTTGTKPWNTPERSLSRYFWNYARYSPFFDEILATNLCGKAKLEKTETELKKSKTELEKTKIELKKSKTELEKTETELKKSKTELEKTKIELKKSKTELEKTKIELKGTKEKLESVYHSASFRIGRSITWAPRKVPGSIQCYRDHGAGYTLRRTLYHMGLWEDEEAPKSPENRPKLVKHAERIFHPKKGK